MNGHQKFVLGLKILATAVLAYNRIHVSELEGLVPLTAIPDGIIFFAIWRSGLTK